MKHWLASAKFTILSVIFLVGFVANAFLLTSPLVAGFLLLLFIFLIITALGRAAVPREAKATQALFGFFILISTIAIVGSGFYYLASFTAPVAITMVLLSLPLAWLLWQRIPPKEDVPIKGHDPLTGPTAFLTRSGTLITAIIILLFTAAGFILSQSSTEQAIRSPWEVTNPIIFLIFGLAISLLVFLLLRGHERWFSAPLVSMALFIFLAVAFLIFPLGYGFDSFIHRATENHIAEFGTITPKPFYYIGQYAIILFFHYAFLLPIDWLDKILVPLLTALLLPLTWLIAAAHLLKNKKTAVATLAFLFLIPLSSFVVTTPQGLGNLWFLILILLATPRLTDKNNLPIWPLVVGGLATALIHPIAGIPALLFLGLMAANPNDQKQKYPRLAQVFSWIIILFGSLALPATFIINSLRSGQGWGLNFLALSPTALIHNLHLDLFFANRFSPILDFVYLFGWNQILLLFIGALVGLIWAWRNSGATGLPTVALAKVGRSPLRIYAAMTAILVINFLILNSAVDFSFLIDYERGNYAARLIPLIIFCLIPGLIFFAGHWFSSLEKKPLVLKISSAILLSALIVSNFYLTYPRQDAYETNHGYNLSLADIAAVTDIERDAAGVDYVVLANQMSSAAAIKEFGFKKYYNDQFFYPIPTGNPLYQLFLKMNDHPARETALAAMDLLEVDRVYYLVSNYWWQSEKIVETAKTNADDWWVVNDGKITVFEYKR
ncbi:MAG: hypothetical protein V1664_02720 [Candidatus Uhrbacteria bacterium]